MKDDWRMCEFCISLINSSLAGITYMYLCLIGKQSMLLSICMCIWFGVVYNSILAFVKRAKVWALLVLLVWAMFSNGMMKIAVLFSDVTYGELQTIVVAMCTMCFVSEYLYRRCSVN